MQDDRIAKPTPLNRYGKASKGGRKSSRPRKRLSRVNELNKTMSMLGGS